MIAKRRVSTELIKGVEAMKGQREGKLTVRSYRIEATPLPPIDTLQGRSEVSDRKIEKRKKGKVKTRTL